jgi:hypothetical protein
MRCRHVILRSDYPPTSATWGARCGKSARRVLRGGTGTRAFAQDPSLPTNGFEPAANSIQVVALVALTSSEPPLACSKCSKKSSTEPIRSERRNTARRHENSHALLCIPWTAARRLIAEDQLPAIRAGRGGKFFIARTALVKFVERIK